MVCSLWRHRAGVFAHRCCVANNTDKRFDGDTASFNVVYTDEAVEEIRMKLNKRDTYVNTEGGLVSSAVVDTVERVLRSMTGS